MIFPYTMAGNLLAPLDATSAEEDIDVDSGPDQVAAGAEPIGEPHPAQQQS